MSFWYTACVWTHTFIIIWTHTSGSIRLPAHMYDYLNVDISVLLSVHTSVWLPECGYQCPSVCPHTYMTAWMYVSLSICLSTHLYDYMNVDISILLSVHIPTWLPECMYHCPSVCPHTLWLHECGYQCPSVCPHTLWLPECGYQCPSVCPHTYMTAWMYVSLSICLSTHLMTTWK